MRRQHAVHHRQAGHQRDPDLDQRYARASRDGEHEGDEKNETDLEEDGDSHNERDEHDRPVNTTFAEQVDERARYACGSP